jgi:tetratricopeptide (TPR) repeat protein
VIGFCNKKQFKPSKQRMHSFLMRSGNVSPFISQEAASWYAKGDKLARKACYAEALACFDQVIERQPNHQAAWVFRAVMLLYLEKPNEALVSCDQAIQICSSSQEAWLFRGAALQRLGEYRQAYASYNHSLKLVPSEDC